MEYLPTVLWMLLFPVFIALTDFINKKAELLKRDKCKEYSEGVEGFTAHTLLILWIGFGFALYLAELKSH